MEDDSSLVRATEVTKNMAWTIAGLAATGLCMCGIDLYVNKLPIYEPYWIESVIALTGVPGSIDRGSDNLNARLSSIDKKMEVLFPISQSMQSLDGNVSAMNGSVRNLDGSVHYMGGKVGQIQNQFGPGMMKKFIPMSPW